MLVYGAFPTTIMFEVIVYNGFAQCSHGEGKAKTPGNKCL